MGPSEFELLTWLAIRGPVTHTDLFNEFGQDYFKTLAPLWSRGVIRYDHFTFRYHLP